MSVTWPANARGPRLTLALPSYASPLDCIITNVTTGERMVLNLPVWDGDDLTLDWYRRTIVDQDGADRSSLLAPLDHALWHINPLNVGANTLQIQMASGTAVLSDTFIQTAGDLNGKSLDTGGTWAAGTGATAFKAVGDGRAKRLGAGGDSARAGSSNYAACRAEVEVTFTAGAFGFNEDHGVLLRYVDASNYAYAALAPEGTLQLHVSRVVAGSATSMSDGGLGVSTELNQPYRLVAEAYADGHITCWVYRGPTLLDDNGAGATTTTATAASLATGGALDDGKVGLIDSSDQAAATYYDNFEARDLTVGGSYTGATATLSWDRASYG